MIRIIDLLKCKDQEVFVPAMRTIGNVLTSNLNEDILSYYLSMGLLKNLGELFNSANTTV